MPNAVRRKKILVLSLIAASLLLFSAWLIAVERGPYVCDNGCSVRSPLPDLRTRDFLDTVIAPIDRAPFLGSLTGVEYIVCNETHCTTYRLTFDGEWVGSERTPIEGEETDDGSDGHSGGGGGGGGGGGIGGGAAAGCIYGCRDGTVTTGDPVRVPDEESDQ